MNTTIKKNQKRMEEFNIEFTYQQYQEMTPEERSAVYYALYAFFNEQALDFDISQRQVFDFIFEKTVRDQHYEFAAIMRDFKIYFEDDF